ncbi:hypothetical protein VTO42DRAFT_2144 [Malbranchea cinnamomea]
MSGIPTDRTLTFTIPLWFTSLRVTFGPPSSEITSAERSCPEERGGEGSQAVTLLPPQFLTSTPFPSLRPRSGHAHRGAQQVTPITRVPLDIFLSIIDFLPPADIASLALTGKCIHTALGGNTVFKSVLKTVEDRVSFLRRIEQHFPNHLLCHQCGFFHSREAVDTLAFKETECYAKNGKFEFGWYDLPFTKFQEVMNRHRFGENAGPPMETLSRPGAAVQSCCASRHIRYVKTEPKIIGSELILTVWVWGTFDRHLTRADAAANWLLRAFCPHQLASAVVALLRPRVGRGYCLRCPHCLSEFVLEFLPSSCCEFTVTLCMGYNLGDGRSPLANTRWGKLTTPVAMGDDACEISYYDLRYITR